MQFLRTLFWALLVGVLVAFAINNWTSVDIKLWGGLIAQINLPLLLAVVFLLGFLPTQILYHASRWRMRQRLASTERALNDLRAAHAVAPAPALMPDDPVIEPTPVAPAAPATVAEPTLPLSTGDDATGPKDAPR